MKVLILLCFSIVPAASQGLGVLCGEEEPLERRPCRICVNRLRDAASSLAQGAALRKCALDTGITAGSLHTLAIAVNAAMDGNVDDKLKEFLICAARKYSLLLQRFGETLQTHMGVQSPNFLLTCPPPSLSSGLLKSFQCLIAVCVQHIQDT